MRSYWLQQRARRAVEAQRSALCSALQHNGLHHLPAEAFSYVPRQVEQGGVIELRDVAGKRYCLRELSPTQIAAELSVYQLRTLGARPVVPVRALEVECGSRRVSGQVKPQVPSVAHNATDVAGWSDLQRTLLLLEHPWAWLADCGGAWEMCRMVETHAGPLPLIVDWSNAFHSGATGSLAPPPKNRTVSVGFAAPLYSAYVSGAFDLPLPLLLEEAARIEALATPGVVGAIAPYVERRYVNSAEREAFVYRVIERKRYMVRQFRSFMRDLVEQRKAAPGRPRVVSEVRKRVHQAKHWWQTRLQRG